MGTTQTGPAHTVLDWLRRQQQPEWSKRDIHRKLCRRLSLADLDTALQLLAAHGHIRIHQPARSGRGRRPAPRISVHPFHTGGTK
jgi:hypothetical protein